MLWKEGNVNWIEPKGDWEKSNTLNKNGMLKDKLNILVNALKRQQPAAGFFCHLNLGRKQWKYFPKYEYIPYKLIKNNYLKLYNIPKTENKPFITYFALNVDRFK